MSGDGEITVGELGRRIRSLEDAINALPDRLDARFVSREVFELKTTQLDEKVGAIQLEQLQAERDRQEAKRWRIATAVAGSSAVLTTIVTAILH